MDPIAWLVLWGILGTLALKEIFSLNLLSTLLLVVFLVMDIYILDGYLMWVVLRFLGSKIALEEHIKEIAVIKPPILYFQEVALFLALFFKANMLGYYLTLLLEFLAFVLFASKFHKLGAEQLFVFGLLLFAAISLFATPAFVSIVRLLLH